MPRCLLSAVRIYVGFGTTFLPKDCTKDLDLLASLKEISDHKLHLLVQELQLTARGSRSDVKPIKLQRERMDNLKFSAMIGKSLLQETPLSRRWKHHMVEPFGTWKHIYLCFHLLVVVSPFGLLN